MPELTINLFGYPQITLDGAPVETDRRKAVALLAFLAVSGKPHSRETLSGFFWGDYDQSSALAYLRRTLWEANQMLGEGWVETQRDLVALPLTPEVQVDVIQFERLSLQVRDTDDPAARLSLLEQALALYRGDFLAGFTLRDSPEFDDWQYVTAENLRGKLGEALDVLSRLYQERGEIEAALERARRWVALDQLNEAAHRRLMALHAQAGQRNAAVRQFRALERILKEELNAKPEEESYQLLQRIQAGELVERVQPLAVPEAARETQAVRTGAIRLPPQLTAFVGREAELREIETLLVNPECRLLSLIGPGGMGKTRLSTRAAEHLAEVFPHGVYFVPLAQVQSGEMIVPAIADSLQYSFRMEARDPRDRVDARGQLLDYLREKRLLLVLDNFEHLVSNAGLVADILMSSPEVKIITTSRERLNLPGEWAFEVDGLTLPENGEDYKQLEQYSAIQLFLQAARRVKPGFTPQMEEMGCISRICKLVGGMPLGIELAASWLRVLTCREIGDEIERNLDFLASSMRNLPERHRSLRAVFEHSWQSMAEGEQQVYQRLPVFRGGFNRLAAAAVAEASLTQLTHLVDKSLLRQYQSGRYDLHPVLNQFAAEKLAENPTSRYTVEEAHSIYYLNLASDAGEKLKSARYREGRQEILQDLGNIRRALLWALENDQLEQIQFAMISLQLYFSIRGNFIEALETLRPLEENLLQKNACGADTMCRYLLAQVQGMIGSYLWALDQWDEGGEKLRACWEVLKTQPPGYLRAWTLLQINFGFHLLSNDEARQLAQEALATFRRTGELWGEARTLMHMGELMQWLHDEDKVGGEGFSAEGIRLREEALWIFKSLGNTVGYGQSLFSLAQAYYWNGYHEKARDLMAQVLTFREVTENKWWELSVIFFLGQVNVALGKLDEAMKSYDRSMKIAEELGARGLVCVHHDSMGYIDLLRGDYRSAENHYRTSLELSGQIGDNSGKGMAMSNLGDVALARGDEVSAEKLFTESLAILQPLDYRLGVAKNLKCLGRLHLQRKDLNRAADYFRQGISYSARVEWLPEVVDCLIGFGQLLAWQGNLEKAVELLAFAVKSELTRQCDRDTAHSLLNEIQAELPGGAFKSARARGEKRTIPDLVREWGEPATGR